MLNPDTLYLNTEVKKIIPIGILGLEQNKRDKLILYSTIL